MLSNPVRPLLIPIVVLILGPLVPAQGGEEAAPRPHREVRLWNCVGDAADLPAADPAGGEVALVGAADGWNAFHVFRSDTWRLHCIGAGFFSTGMGSPQLLVMDEVGRGIVLQSDSGKWSPHVAVEDRSSMSAWAQVDFDASVPGPETYVGGSSGLVHRLMPLPGRDWTSQPVASVGDSSVSKLVAGDLAPDRPGEEMIALTNDGPVFELHPDPAKGRELVVERIGDLGTRTRDAVLLPANSRRPPTVLALLQTGEVALLVLGPGGLERGSLCREPMSIARLARRRPLSEGDAEVVYVARTDGLILRFVESPDGSWLREPIYAGPNGPRGLAAGRFDADAGVESVAVFGYSKKVQIVSRRPGESWGVETIFTDNGGGHWLTTAELDGRNDTDELVGGGFSYHVFMLTRRPGYGLPGVAVDPDGGIPDYEIPASRTAPRIGRERGQEAIVPASSAGAAEAPRPQGSIGRPGGGGEEAPSRGLPRRF